MTAVRLGRHTLTTTFAGQSPNRMSFNVCRPSSRSRALLTSATLRRPSGATDDRTASDDARQPKLTLYTGTDCQLCDVAKEVLDDVAREASFSLDLYNIRDDSMPDIARWRRKYQYDIPVLHLNGTEIARHRLDRDNVLEKIRSATTKT